MPGRSCQRRAGGASHPGCLLPGATEDPSALVKPRGGGHLAFSTRSPQFLERSGAAVGAPLRRRNGGQVGTSSPWGAGVR